MIKVHLKWAFFYLFLIFLILKQHKTGDIDKYRSFFALIKKKIDLK